VKQFELNVGDKLEWSFEARSGELIIIVRPIKKGNLRTFVIFIFQ